MPLCLLQQQKVADLLPKVICAEQCVRRHADWIAALHYSLSEWWWTQWICFGWVMLLLARLAFVGLLIFQRNSDRCEPAWSALSMGEADERLMRASQSTMMEQRRHCVRRLVRHLDSVRTVAAEALPTQKTERRMRSR